LLDLSAQLSFSVWPLIWSIYCFRPGGAPSAPFALWTDARYFLPSLLCHSPLSTVLYLALLALPALDLPLFFSCAPPAAGLSISYCVTAKVMDHLLFGKPSISFMVFTGRSRAFARPPVLFFRWRSFGRPLYEALERQEVNVKSAGLSLFLADGHSESGGDFSAVSLDAAAQVFF